MKTILIPLISLLLTVGAAAEQKIYYHYINIYSGSSVNGPSREVVNNPVEVIKFLKDESKVVIYDGCYIFEFSDLTAFEEFKNIRIYQLVEPPESRG